MEAKAKMLQFKLIFFAVIIFAVRGTEIDSEFDSVGIKRSAVCLIDRVAKHNNLTVHYEKVSLQHHKNGTTNIKCKLELGTEQYTANSTSFAKAKENAAREAYALTKYSKPSIGNRTCIIQLQQIKSDISLLEEYATALHKEVRYVQKPQAGRISFEIEVSLDDKTANGLGAKKKIAKAAAAHSLIEKIGRNKIIDRLAQKFNGTEYQNMDPIQRLRKIVRITDFNGDGEYNKVNEIMETKEGKSHVKSVVVRLHANDYVTTGSGATFQEASSNAAANLLRTMNFTVTYNPPSD